MAILTYIGIALLCLGYLGILFVSLSSKPVQDEKNEQSMPNDTHVAVNQSESQPSNLPTTGTPG
jgi:hypothetical protein